MTDKVIHICSLLQRPSQAYTLYSAEGIAPTLQSGEKRYGGLPVWVLIYDND